MEGPGSPTGRRCIRLQEAAPGSCRLWGQSAAAGMRVRSEMWGFRYPLALQDSQTHPLPDSGVQAPQSQNCLGAGGTPYFLSCIVEVPPAPSSRTPNHGGRSLFTPRWRCEAHALPRPPLHREEYYSPGIRGGSLSSGRGIWLAPKVKFTLQAIDSWSDPSPSMSQAYGNRCGQSRLRVTRLGLPGH